MPSVVRSQDSTPIITKFTNCRLVRNNRLVEADLWVSSLTGKILRSQEEFYEHQLSPDQVIDLDGRILAPGFIDVQLNGAQGFDFSVAQDKASAYQDGLQLVNKGLIKTGVTSYLPTVTSQRREVYHKVSYWPKLPPLCCQASNACRSCLSLVHQVAPALLLMEQSLLGLIVKVHS
jgi:N-acetylglucosamine-6-phosphate deacetylase